MLKVLVVFPRPGRGNGLMERFVPAAAASLTSLFPDYCECDILDLSVDTPTKEMMIGSDLVIIYGTSGDKAAVDDILRLSRRMYTPVTIIEPSGKAGGSRVRGADFTISGFDPGTIREFLTDFRGGNPRQEYR